MVGEVSPANSRITTPHTECITESNTQKTHGLAHELTGIQVTNGGGSVASQLENADAGYWEQHRSN